MVACHLFFILPVSWDWFLHFLMVKKVKRKRIFCDTWKHIKLKFQYPEIKCYWNSCAYLCIVFSCFPTTVAEFSSITVCMASNSQNTVWPFLSLSIPFMGEGFAHTWHVSQFSYLLLAGRVRSWILTYFYYPCIFQNGFSWFYCFTVAQITQILGNTSTLKVHFFFLLKLSNYS